MSSRPKMFLQFWSDKKSQKKNFACRIKISLIFLLQILVFDINYALTCNQTFSNNLKFIFFLC